MGNAYIPQALINDGVIKRMMLSKLGHKLMADTTKLTALSSVLVFSIDIEV